MIRRAKGQPPLTCRQIPRAYLFYTRKRLRRNPKWKFYSQIFVHYYLLLKKRGALTGKSYMLFSGTLYVIVRNQVCCCQPEKGSARHPPFFRSSLLHISGLCKPMIQNSRIIDRQSVSLKTVAIFAENSPTTIQIDRQYTQFDCTNLIICPSAVGV